MSLIAMLPGRAAVTVREINKYSLPSCYGLKFSFSACKVPLLKKAHVQARLRFVSEHLNDSDETKLNRLY